MREDSILGAPRWRRRGKGKVQMASKRIRSRVGVFAVLATLVLTAALAASASAEIRRTSKNHPLLQPIDAQNWVDQAELTHARLQAGPDGNPAFYDPPAGCQNKYRTAVVLLDFTDQPFLISTQAGSHAFGNPQPGWTPVPARGERVDGRVLLSEPNKYNGFHSLHGYWMEDSHGKIGVDVDDVRPVHDARQAARVRRSGSSTAPSAPADSVCPPGDTCDRNIRTDGGAAWRAGDRLHDDAVRLRQRLLRHRRPRRVVDVAGVRRDAVDRRASSPGGIRASAAPRTARS